MRFRLSTPNPMPKGVPNGETCNAKSKQTGDRCKRPRVPGAMVCRYHGGAAPRTIAKAKERLLAAADPAAAYLAETVKNKRASDADRLKAALGILDRAGYAPKQAIEHTGADGGPIETVIRVEFAEGGAGE
mgnify:CR=1 FL=1